MKPLRIYSIQNYYPCNPSRPNLVDYFTYSFQNKCASRNFSGLKYVPKSYFCTASPRSKILIKHCTPLVPGLAINIVSIFDQIRCSSSYSKASIVTTRDVLSKILIAPFKKEGEKKLTITVIAKDGKIFLYDAEHANIREEEYQKDSFSEYRLFKQERYLFVDEPGMNEPYLVQGSSQLLMNQFYEVYEMKINNKRIIYTADIGGVNSEYRIGNMESLKLANHVEAVLSFNRQDLNNLSTNISEQFVTFLEMWAKCKLTLSDHVICGKYATDINAAPDAVPDAAPDAVPDAAPDAVPDAAPGAAGYHGHARASKEWRPTKKRSKLASDAAPEAVPSAVAGAVPGAVPGAAGYHGHARASKEWRPTKKRSKLASDAAPEAVPSAVAGAVPGAVPGAAPGAVPGAVAGAVPGAVPGAASKEWHATKTELVDDKISDIELFAIESLLKLNSEPWKPKSSYNYLCHFLNCVQRNIEIIPLSDRHDRTLTFQCTSKFEVILLQN